MSQSASPRDASATVHPADSVIRTGTMYSMAADRSIYRAIALRDEWIIAVSADPHGLDGLVSADTRVIDEPDLTILPAFDDDHNHFILAADEVFMKILMGRPKRNAVYRCWSSMIQSFEPDEDCRWCYIDQRSL